MKEPDSTSRDSENQDEIRVGITREGVTYHGSSKNLTPVLLKVVITFLSCVVIYFVMKKNLISHKAKVDMDRYNHKHNNYIKTPDKDCTPEAYSSWDTKFHLNYQMPFLYGDLKTLLNSCPKGYEDAMLIHLLTMYGALCFSQVRAKYLDGKLHSPSLQTIIEANWGTGKGKFNMMYNSLFRRIIKKDNSNVGKENRSSIIQTLGVGVSSAMFNDIIAKNKGVFIYIFSSEVRAMIDDLKKGNGLSYLHLRLAFDNDPIYQNKKNGAPKGSFPVYLNYTFTGTPGDVQKFIAKELEGGTASRICWLTIPDAGRELESLNLPAEKTMNLLRDRIDKWRLKYCYESKPDSIDLPKAVTVVDLDYLFDPLNKWINSQYDLAKVERNPTREQARTRIATIAFHCAIIIHMLYDRPTTKYYKRRNMITDLTLYIANYCMERFLHKFSEANNSQLHLSKTSEFTKKPFKLEEIQEWKSLHEQGWSWKNIADKYGTSKDTVRGRVNRI